MHPIVILLPLFGLIVFIFLPLNVALPVYLFILLVSGLMYWAIARAMRRRTKYGTAGLVGAEARVTSKLAPGEEAQYLVRVRGELWRANSKEELRPGDRATVLSVEGLLLSIGKRAAESPPG